MRDNDTKILEEKYESLFSGKLEEEEDTSLGASEDKDDKDEKDSDDKEEKSEDSDDSKDEDSEDKSDDSDDSDKDDDGDDDSESTDSDSGDSDESDSSPDSAGGDAGIQSKVKQLQKQYNDLLVDAFEKYAAECIENALDGVESSFGENIQDILDGALQELKGKILGDLGVEDAMATCPMGGGMGGGMGAGPEGGMEVDLGDKPDVEFGSEVGGIPTVTVDTGSEEGPQDDEASDEKEDVEEACGDKKHTKEKKIVKESALAAEFYGFV